MQPSSCPSTSLVLWGLLALSIILLLRPSLLPWESPFGALSAQAAGAAAAPPRPRGPKPTYCQTAWSGSWVRTTLEEAGAFPAFESGGGLVRWEPAPAAPPAAGTASAAAAPAAAPACKTLRHFTQEDKRQCLVERGGLLLLGDSTSRELLAHEVALLNASEGELGYPAVFPCSASQGLGCYSCKRGCICRDLGFRADEPPVLHGHKSLAYWLDIGVGVAEGRNITFSWKPDAFSLEEMNRLQGIQDLEQRGELSYGLIVASKGVHAAFDVEECSMEPSCDSLYDKDRRLQAMVDLSRQLAAYLAQQFPDKLLVWRHSYVNPLSPGIEAMLARLRAETDVVFREAGFEVIPAHLLGSGEAAPPAHDGTHQHEAVKSLVMDGLLSLMWCVGPSHCAVASVCPVLTHTPPLSL